MSLPNQRIYWPEHAARSVSNAIQDVTLPRVEEYGAPRRQVRSVYRKQASRLPNMVYLMVWAALLLCVFQCLRTIMVEAYKFSIFVKNQPIIERYYRETVQEHRVLQDKIKTSSSPANIEAMARNALNLTGDQEILVHLH